MVVRDAIRKASVDASPSLPIPPLIPKRNAVVASARKERGFERRKTELARRTGAGNAPGTTITAGLARGHMGTRTLSMTEKEDGIRRAEARAKARIGRRRGIGVRHGRRAPSLERTRTSGSRSRSRRRSLHLLLLRLPVIPMDAVRCRHLLFLLTLPLSLRRRLKNNLWMMRTLMKTQMKKSGPSHCSSNRRRRAKSTRGSTEVPCCVVKEALWRHS